MLGKLQGTRKSYAGLNSGVNSHHYDYNSRRVNRVCCFCLGYLIKANTKLRKSSWTESVWPIKHPSADTLPLQIQPGHWLLPGDGAGDSTMSPSSSLWGACQCQPLVAAPQWRYLHWIHLREHSYCSAGKFVCDSSGCPFKNCLNLLGWLCQKPIRQHFHKLLSIRAVAKRIWGWWPCPLTQLDQEGSEEEWKEQLLPGFLSNCAIGWKKHLLLRQRNETQ